MTRAAWFAVVAIGATAGLIATSCTDERDDAVIDRLIQDLGGPGTPDAVLPEIRGHI